MLLAALLLATGTGLASAWIPFFGREIHRHADLTEHHKEWDLLHYAAKDDPGVTPQILRAGNFNTTTYNLKPTATFGLLPSHVTHQLSSRVHGELSAYFCYRQHNNTRATLLSVTTDKTAKPMLQISSDLRRRELQLVYRLKGDSLPHHIAVPLTEKAGHLWTRLLVSLANSTLRVILNCQRPIVLPLPGTLDVRVPFDAQVFFAKETHSKNHLLGAVQAVDVFNWGVEEAVWRCGGPDQQFGSRWKPPLLG